MECDRVYVVQNTTTGQFLKHGNGRLAIFWNPKMAKRAANSENKRTFMVYNEYGFRESVRYTFHVLELDPNTGTVLD